MISPRIIYQCSVIHSLVFITHMVIPGISTSRSANISIKIGITNRSITATTPIAAMTRMIG